MVIIPKSEVAEQAKLDTLYSIRKCSSEIALFEKKYNCTLKEFEKKRKKAGKEIFEEYFCSMIVFLFLEKKRRKNYN